MRRKAQAQGWQNRPKLVLANGSSLMTSQENKPIVGDV